MSICTKITFNKKEARDAVSAMRREGVITCQQGSIYWCNAHHGHHVTSLTRRETKRYNRTRRGEIFNEVHRSGDDQRDHAKPGGVRGVGVGVDLGHVDELVGG